jgi:hypothetical protein
MHMQRDEFKLQRGVSRFVNAGDRRQPSSTRMTFGVAPCRDMSRRASEHESDVENGTASDGEYHQRIKRRAAHFCRSPARLDTGAIVSVAVQVHAIRKQWFAEGRTRESSSQLTDHG